jgi:hypothetical protein
MVLEAEVQLQVFQTLAVVAVAAQEITVAEQLVLLPTAVAELFWLDIL